MNKDLEDADKKIHPVETQWHYEIMTRYGFVAQTKEAIGFSRTYKYEHPKGHKIDVTTGISSDYWENKAAQKRGYWSALEGHVKQLMETK